MRSPRSHRSIPPKVSTMPRQQSEASAYLQIYQRVVEKKRLQQELQSIEDRRLQIYQRLEAIAAEIAQIQTTAQPLRSHTNPPPTDETSSVLPTAAHPGTFKTMTLEY